MYIKNEPSSYTHLCSIFYDITKAYAPEKEVNFYAKLIDKNPGKVLEAMSGSGRLQIPLAQRGYIVDGIDNSFHMLSRFKERCENLSLKLTTYEQNLENMNLESLYTTITIAVGSFQLLYKTEAAINALQNLSQHMTKNGQLLIDTFMPDFNCQQYSTRIAHINKNSFIRLTTRYEFDQKNKRADAYCNYDLITHGIIEKSETELIQTTWYSDDEFVHLCHQANLKIKNIYQESFRSTSTSRIFHIEKI